MGVDQLVTGGDVDNPVFQSVSTDQAHISERWDFETGYQAEPTTVTETSDYASEPYLIPLDNGEVMLFYHRGSEHAANDSAAYQRKVSASDLQANGVQAFVNASETLVESDATYGIRGQSIGKASDGTLVFWYMVWGDGGIGFQSLHYQYSTDNGDSWSSRQNANISNLSEPAPFGGVVQTTNGLMQLFYDDAGVVALFSTDNGQTWGTETPVFLASGLKEPVPCAVTHDKLIVLMRTDNPDGRVRYITSDDGGSSWGQSGNMYIRSGTTNTPVWARPTGENEVTVMLGDRDDWMLYAWQVAGQAFHDDPTILEDAPRKPIYRGLERTRTANFGYPTTAQLGDDSKHIWWAAYDGDGQSGTSNITDVILGSLPNVSGSRVYQDSFDLKDVQGRSLQDMSAFLTEDFGDNAVTNRTKQTVGSYFATGRNTRLLGYYRPTWTELGTNGASYQNQRIEWTAGTGNSDWTLDPASGVPTVGRWRFTLRFSTLGGSSDDFAWRFIEQDSTDNWTIFVIDSGSVILRKNDAGASTDFTGSWGAGGTGDTDLHTFEIERTQSGQWTVTVDGSEIISAKEPFLPTPDHMDFRFSDSNGGSVIHLESLEAGLR